MIKRFICWCRGHDYYFGYARTAEDFLLGGGTVFTITLCNYCGVRHVEPQL